MNVSGGNMNASNGTGGGEYGQTASISLSISESYNQTAAPSTHTNSSPQQKQQQQPNSPVLPLNWEQRTDPKTGRVYYANLVTKSTQWEFPAF